MYIHENLLWNTHVNHVSNKVSRATSILARLKRYLPKYVLKLIFTSLCLSHISYALSVWGASPVSVIGRLQKLHKKGIRHVCNAKYNAHSEPLLKQENILNIQDLFNLQCIKIVYKKINKSLPNYHVTKLRTNFDITKANTRTKHDIYIEKPVTNLTKINSLNHKIGTSWNQLENEIRAYTSKCLPTFTKHANGISLSTANIAH